MTRVVEHGRLVSDLYGHWKGKPILVVGGGPSALEDIIRVPDVFRENVISANAHGFKIVGLRPGFVFCKDHTHTENKQAMEPQVRFPGVPVVTRHYWADYRAVPWNFPGNSGMHAIVLAALMGGHPVIPIGFDCFQQGTYFHSLNSKNVSLGRPEPYWQARMKRLCDTLKSCAIRPLSGPLTTIRPRFNSREVLPPVQIPEVFAEFAGQQTWHVRTKREFLTPFDKRVGIPADYVLPVSAREHQQYLRLGTAEPFGPMPAVTKQVSGKRYFAVGGS